MDSAIIDLWRARGDDRVNPVRFGLIDAMSRRAMAHEGEARRIIDERLSALIEDYAREVKAAGSAAEAPRAEQTPLASLIEALTLHAASYPSHAELLDYLRTVWSKVSAERQLRESLEQVPKNAGPLNSSSLVHRSLALMREVSPAYLQHFLAYVDTLSWMEAMTGANAPAGKDAPRAKKSARGGAR
ncbi:MULTISPECIES: DUF2894 domain-containing protein [unclassified Caballeronia]|uniref:DUF2894 domain-containing protein n=1 Tax=unclassified Caballeronia TaxID=2646786 RepID=UPI002858842E|nr:MULTISPECIES: DUF2894 domain-containing protein [unclassified Caballeronia]MDR5740405.1 DUF2894 domain-containing protein [Caballeronia sp. LZ016]MDR5808416.1 DUF2894 domain-containing protein [Caballeronia sp. LZ019]